MAAVTCSWRSLTLGSLVRLDEARDFMDWRWLPVRLELLQGLR